MSIAADQRAAYELLHRTADKPLIVEQPVIFSPAAGAQNLSNGRTGVQRFGPMYLPLEFTSWVEESAAHSQSAYLGDWSSLGKALIGGPDALEFLSQLGMNDLSDFALGQIKHHVQLDQNGWIASEGILLRLDEQRFQYSAGSVDWLLWQFTLGEWDAAVKDITPDQYILGVQGPRSLEILEVLTGESLRDIAFNRSRLCTIAGVSTRVLRTGISAELGYELHGSADDANLLWNAIVEAGAPYGLKELGLRSQPVQHIEAGIATNGLDYLPASILSPAAPWQFRSPGAGGSFIPSSVTDYFRKPGELGWGGRIGADSHDFIGREAVLAANEAGGSARVLVGLRWNADDVIAVAASLFSGDEIVDQMEQPRIAGAAFDQVLIDGEPVGVSTGRTVSVVVRATISLAVINREHSALGTEVTVLWGRPGSAQRHIRATVSALPFKPDNRRVDVSAL